MLVSELKRGMEVRWEPREGVNNFGVILRVWEKGADVCVYETSKGSNIVAGIENSRFTEARWPNSPTWEVVQYLPSVGSVWQHSSKNYNNFRVVTKIENGYIYYDAFNSFGSSSASDWFEYFLLNQVPIAQSDLRVQAGKTFVNIHENRKVKNGEWYQCSCCKEKIWQYLTNSKESFEPHPIFFPLFKEVQEIEKPKVDNDNHPCLKIKSLWHSQVNDSLRLITKLDEGFVEYHYLPFNASCHYEARIRIENFLETSTFLYQVK